MSKAEETSGTKSQGNMSALDEEFFTRVDRVMLSCKQSDPLRLQQVRPAAEEEARLANMTNSHGLEQRRAHDHDGMR